MLTASPKSAATEPGRSRPIYCASKYAVRAFPEGLRQENTDLRVSAVSPGFTLTGLTDRGGNAEAQAATHPAWRLGDVGAV
ncbi:NAD(P)-dependent dehydrogenase (short-subunit alcohol dehydrogenase family) [Pseudarthrobacter defluvii]|uniref:SDR family NAD(P)-dependent oxidoreductase n=1 Tax=Pseudarthrobacter defluvii TaxID=410837 RepID=UPI002785923F|nr:SDR family NAD(P)-dependent oxidoreductase [Pseudarthrobacter defluvii]MDQ0769277.1 NAD(P)-dependent dehydrogenase (short-subunit alcohol dehydrogenase family) [Pseudarthrobacter defluvii]